MQKPGNPNAQLMPATSVQGALLPPIWQPQPRALRCDKRNFSYCTVFLRPNPKQMKVLQELRCVKRWTKMLSLSWNAQTGVGHICGIKPPCPVAQNRARHL